LEDKKVTLKRR